MIRLAPPISARRRGSSATKRLNASSVVPSKTPSASSTMQKVQAKLHRKANVTMKLVFHHGSAGLGSDRSEGSIERRLRGDQLATISPEVEANAEREVRETRLVRAEERRERRREAALFEEGPERRRADAREVE